VTTTASSPAGERLRRVGRSRSLLPALIITLLALAGTDAAWPRHEHPVPARGAGEVLRERLAGRMRDLQRMLAAWGVSGTWHLSESAGRDGRRIVVLRLSLSMPLRELEGPARFEVDPVSGLVRPLDGRARAVYGDGRGLRAAPGWRAP
jgi:hypothetical protein